MSVIVLPHFNNKILFGENSMEYLYNELRKLKPYKIGLVTDENIAKIFSKEVEEMMNHLNIEMVFILNDGEHIKTIDNAIEIWRNMVINGFTRKSLLIGFGGGSISDLAGFIASTYMRGIYYVNIPTTLLSQADASIGGKNGVDFYGKNIIGTFYIPTLTIIDPKYILTLPWKKFADGFVEIIKHCMLSSPYLIQYIEDNLDKIRSRDLKVVKPLILESIKIKLQIVSKDLFEQGHRMILNLGHTIGHAIEAASNYRVSHGEAVSQGLVVCMDIGERLFSFDEKERIISILKDLGLPTRITINPKEIMKEMKKDKKFWYGKCRLIVPRKLGDVRIVEVDEDLILEVLGELYENMFIS